MYCNNTGITTVEAVIIVPICLIITMLLFWLGIYYYDKNAMAQIAGQGAVYGAENSELSNDEIVEIIDSKITEITGDRLIFVDKQTSKVDVDINKITVEMTGELNVPGDSWDIHTIQIAPRLKSSMFVRMLNGIKQMEEVNNE